MLGYTISISGIRHASLYKVLVLKDKTYVHIKRGDLGAKLYEEQFHEFKIEYASIFNRKAMMEMEKSFMRGIDDW
jgi:hypothetical protein